MRRAYQVDLGPFPVAKFTAEDWRKQRWGYYRMVEKVDAEIGKLLAALRARRDARPPHGDIDSIEHA